MKLAGFLMFLAAPLALTHEAAAQVQVAKLDAPILAQDYLFGHSVSLSGDTAIVALERSQQIKETQDNYYSMAKLFQAEGDAKNAIAASVLATVIDESPSTVHELKINPQALRKSIQASALAKQ